METNQAKKHEEHIAKANQATEEGSSRIKEERFRLRYHLMPRTGWMNDPNGLVYFKGSYHAFYQYYPYEPSWGPMHWGHAKSEDLVNWTHLPVALAPSESYDQGESGGYGCFSGSAVADGDSLALLYTGHVSGNSPVEVQCLAVSSDEGITFRKSEANPVIPGPPEEGLLGFRDPKVWKHEDTWYMVIGSGKEGRGNVRLYASSDLRDWRNRGIAADSDGSKGDMWECPDLFPLGGGENHVLIVSPMNMGATKTMYLSGTFDYEAGKLTTAHAERLDYGFDFYAPQTLENDQGRRILFGWMNMWGAKMPEQQDGWAGAMTIPRELSLQPDGSIRMVPVPELEKLRGERYEVESQVIEADTEVALPGIVSDAAEIIAVFDASHSDAAEFGLRLRCSADGSEYTEVGYRAADRTLYVNRDHAGLGDGGISEVQLTSQDDGLLKLHLFLDRSSLELFANDGEKTMTNRIYPQPDSLGASLFSRGGNAVLRSFEAYELKSIH
ncbi:glycoside hydrolase family 32 protein [Paenibacillus sp. BC26]|uniref:glycoside hydrolase family 32 protein n=1 Tax=Paenibacillus sp. BC26 TaxID=1881032 RepID=UPI0008EB22D2|nr:glycoside hydrolase family 32 protein [Paenibacillus sp. BC26]SFT16291.1 beta-fructofuranosidase [Paenibacillus sp. BC26]